MVYENGWGSFIIAYLTILLIMGIWLLIWEIALWQYTRKWAPGALWEISKYLRWVWWAWILTAAIILTYYVVVIWWWIDYLVYSIHSFVTGTPFPWATTQDFFTQHVLKLSSDISTFWGISWPVFWWTLLVWILIYAFTYKSTETVWKVVLVTATVPFITLAILAIRWATLPWAEQGLAYLTTIDVSALKNFKTWIAAAWQIFFTLSLAMGIMIAYWALKKPESEIVQSTILVAVWNTIISFLSAIAVFGTLGYLAQQTNQPITEVIKNWPILAFVTFPEAINHLPAFKELFAILFFATIFMLAIDSAMSLIEAVGVALREKFPNVPVELVTLFVVIILFFGSLIYVFGNGLYILDIVDNYVSQYSMIFIWILEALALVWIWKKLWKFIDERNECKFRFVINKWFFLISWLISAGILGYLLANNLKTITSYWSYPQKYIYMLGIWTLIFIYLVSIGLNLIELKLEKNSKKD